jgi:mono/diheme cytochrome c family protein
MMRHPGRLALLALLAPLVGFAFGGWAVVTVDDVPSHLVAGKPTPITFTVRQHGVTLLSNLSPSVDLKSGSNHVTVAAGSTGEPGRYRATVVPPETGVWDITVQSGFGNSRTTLLPLRAVAANAPAPAPPADAERGHQLFYGKGCVTCHVRGGDGEDGFKIGPALTGRRYVADYVAKFLDDPDSSPLSKANPVMGAKMPKLGLNKAEITALVAFLNSSEVAAR